MIEKSLKIIAHIKSDFPTKFGIPRQSGLCNLKSQIVFEKEYRNPDALRGIEDFSHLWLLWDFSENEKSDWSPTVRPPRLGGNKRVGVFATRSPFRPNSIGLSSVKLERIIKTEQNGLVLEVSGADLLDNTPIFDIKPYIPYTDCHPQAVGGFADDVFGDKLEVFIPEHLNQLVPTDKRSALQEILASDPRPAYQNDENRIYAFEFSKLHIEFSVSKNTLTVTNVKNID